MLLSVIIPVYNNSLSLGGCIDSFRTMGDISQRVEFVVVDDGSKQFTSPEGCNVIHTEHRGAAAARNEGIAAATGRFVWFFDADDKLRSDTILDLLHILERLPDDTDLFHTGDMVALSDDTMQLPKSSVELSATKRVLSQELFVPRTSYLDHTTYIVSRRLLCDNGQLRYPPISILEDSLFMLRLLEVADKIYVNETIRPYLRKTYLESLTAGAWDVERCNRFVPDICYFFDFYGSYLRRHSEIVSGAACYRRLRYVYMRVLSVKGCPWPLIKVFRTASSGAFPIAGIKERLMFTPAVSLTISFLCRIFRKRKQSC